MEITKSFETRRPLRVLFFDLYDPLDESVWSGTPAQIYRCLQEAGVSVTSVGGHGLFFRKAINWIIFRYYRYGKKLFYHIDRDLFWVRAFTRLGNMRLKSFKADAVVTSFPAFTAFVGHGLPVFMIHDATWGQVVESYPWFRRSHQPTRIVEDGFELERIAYSRNDVYPVLTSSWAADRAVADYSVDPERIRILPLGPNLKKPPEKAAVEKALRNRGNRPCKLLFVGKEWVRKGGPLAVEATAALNEMGVPAELHVVGPSELTPGSKAAAELPSFVRLHGFLRKSVSDEAAALETLYLQSDFFILPTQAEALGVVFAEAAAYALPCLGTSVGGVPSILNDGVSGAIFPPTDSAQQMAKWIELHYLEREKYQSLARSARADYEKRLSSLAYGTQLADIIQARIDRSQARKQTAGDSSEKEFSQSA